MKNIISILLALLLCASCSESFLEIYPETSLNENNFLNSQTEFILLANGCYIPLRNYGREAFWVIAELPSDNSSYMENRNDGGSWVRRVFDQFLASSSNTTYASFWDASYNGITRCNKLLYELSRSTIAWDNEAYRERCLGEGHFLRALYYFHLVREFGGVPLVLEPITPNQAASIKRSTEESIYNQIQTDLDVAATAFLKAETIEENGRANYGATLALQGRVYLTLKKHNEAATALKTLIDLNKYALLNNFEDLFNPAKKDYKETIFAIEYAETSADISQKLLFFFAPHTSKGDITKRPNINISGWGGFNQPTQDLINAFEEGDVRKEVSIGWWFGEDWDGEMRMIPYCNKYKPPVSAPDDRCSDNIPLIRYADVLLMYAEVLNELNRTSEAIPFVQQVRTRAGLTTPITQQSKSAISDLIAHERQVELCFENLRWYDLKRTGKALEVMNAHGQREKKLKPYLYENAFEVEPYKLLSPIPVTQIDINKLEQNPGY